MTREEILNAAKQCVCQDRNDQYGSPEDNFETIAGLWTMYKFATREKAVCEFTAEDVAVMMVLLKVARIATGSGSQDNWIDLAGYAACGGEIETKESKNEH